MRFACWIPKATDTHSEQVILIALARQQWLWERASILRFVHNIPFLFPVKIACCPLLRVQYPACNLPAGIIRPEMLGKA
jgi:hypothetical protein